MIAEGIQTGLQYFAVALMAASAVVGLYLVFKDWFK